MIFPGKRNVPGHFCADLTWTTALSKMLRLAQEPLYWEGHENILSTQQLDNPNPSWIERQSMS